MRFNILLILFLGGAALAQELPSEETLGEMVRDTSVDVLSINNAILEIESGNIEKAKQILCASLESNLIILQSLTEYAANVESNSLQNSVAHIAKTSNRCTYSKGVKEFLNNYK